MINIYIMLKLDDSCMTVQVKTHGGVTSAAYGIWMYNLVLYC